MCMLVKLLCWWGTQPLSTPPDRQHANTPHSVTCALPTLDGCLEALTAQGADGNRWEGHCCCLALWGVYGSEWGKGVQVGFHLSSRWHTHIPEHVVTAKRAHTARHTHMACPEATKSSRFEYSTLFDVVERPNTHSMGSGNGNRVADQADQNRLQILQAWVGRCGRYTTLLLQSRLTPCHRSILDRSKITSV